MSSIFHLDTNLQPLPWSIRHPGAEKSWAQIKKCMSVNTSGASKPESWEVPLYTPEDVGGRINYRAMIARAELREVASGLACAHEEPDSFELRIAIALQRTRGMGVVAREGARWVYEGGPQPTRFTVYYQRYEPRPQGKHLRGLVRRVHPKQVLHYGRLRITSPEYTSEDLGLNYPILVPVIR